MSGSKEGKGLMVINEIRVETLPDGLQVAIENGTRVTAKHSKICKVDAERGFIIALGYYNHYTRTVVYIYTGQRVIVIGCTDLVEMIEETRFTNRETIYFSPEPEYYSNPLVQIAYPYVVVLWMRGCQPYGSTSTYDSCTKIISLETGKLVEEKIKVEWR